MSYFSINEMQSMQKELQDKYKEKWERICPETGKNKFLWMIGEIGEVIDIIKKNGDKSTVADSSVREHLIEEMADVLMYYNDVMLCYGITEDELKQAYIEKFQKNMKNSLRSLCVLFYLYLMIFLEQFMDLICWIHNSTDCQIVIQGIND